MSPSLAFDTEAHKAVPILPSFRRGLRALMTLSAALTFLLVPVWYRFPPDSIFPPFPSLYVARFLILLPALATILLWALSGFSGLRQLFARRPSAVWAGSLIGLASWAALSTNWAFMRQLEPAVGQNAAVQIGIAAAFAIAAAAVRIQPRWVITALVLGLAGNAALTIAQARYGSDLGLQMIGEFRFGLDIPTTSFVQADGMRYVRPYGLLPHPNILAGSLVIGLLACGAWLLSRRRLLQALSVAVSGAGFLALLLTFSRAAWGGLALAVLLVIPLVRPLLKQRSAWLPLAAAGIFCAGAGTWFAAEYRPFIAARVGEGQESIELRSISDRLVFTDFALRSIGERPVFGVGIGNFPWRTSYYLVETHYDLRGDNVHHVFLLAWAEVGAVGLALVLTALAGGIWAAWRTIQASGDDERAQRIALFAGVIALTAIGFFDHYPWTLIQFQIAWWGLLALNISRESA